MKHYYPFILVASLAFSPLVYAQDSSGGSETLRLLDEVEDQQANSGTQSGTSKVSQQDTSGQSGQQQAAIQPVRRGIRNARSTQAAWDMPHIPAAGQYNPGVMVYDYEPLNTETIVLRAGTTMLLNFPEWEILHEDNIEVGTNKVVKAKLKGSNQIILSAQNFIGADTNITITGREQSPDPTGQLPSRNVYLFYIRVVGFDYPEKTDLYGQILAPYPFETDKAVTASGTVSLADVLEKSKFKSVEVRKDLPDYLEGAPVNFADMAFNDYRLFYQEESDLEIAPIRVFHDGRFTYLDFGLNRAARIQLPVVKQVIDHIETEVSVRFGGPENSIMVVETVGNLSLRHGNRLVCLRCVAEGSCSPSIAISGARKLGR